MATKLNILKSSILVVIISVIFAFAPDNNGNQDGCQSYNINAIDGVFNIYKYTRDFNFGQAPVEYKQRIGYFLQTRGDTSTKFFNGNLSFSNNNLYYTNRLYMSNDTNDNGSQKWDCLKNDNTVLSYHFTRGKAKVKFNNQNKLQDTITTANGLDINLSGVRNADSVIVTISGFNGSIINKRVTGLTQSISFTSPELSNFISGGIISVSALNIVPATLNNKNYVFSSVHQYLKLVYFKNN